MKSSDTILSFIIPMWNREKTISYCLDSILCQSLTLPFEIIVVDDFSTDGCASIVEGIRGNHTRLSDSTFAKDFPNSLSLFDCLDAFAEFQIRSRIRLYKLHSHQGAAMARNKGLKESLGKYLWFVDSDDFIVHGALQIIRPIIMHHSFDIIQFCTKKYSVIPHSFMVQVEESHQFEELNVFDSHDLLFMLSSGTVWSRLFRRAFVKDELFDLRYSYSEDSQFSWRMALKANSAIFLHSILYGYMFTKDSLTYIKPYDRFACYIKVVEDYINAIIQSHLSRENKDAMIRECEKRLYLHAFYTYSSSEITREMWDTWYEVYYKLMVIGKWRRPQKRIISKLMWICHSNNLFLLIYKLIRRDLPVIIR